MTGEAELGRRLIVLVGFMACGKTTVGRALAQRLGRSFVDTDHEIEHEFGLPVPAIFTRHGEQEFRDAERRLIERLLGRSNEVISIGGGAFVDPNARTSINARAISVWLDPPFELILERIARSGMRPLASGKPPGDLRHLWEERRGSYAEAQVRVATEDEDLDQSVQRILDQMGEGSRAA